MRYCLVCRGWDRTPKGFTLVELVIVLTVIGFLTALAAPRIDLARMRLEAGLRGASSALLAAQRLAVVRQHDVIVSVAPAGTALVVHEDANNNGIPDAGERERTVPLGEGVVVGLGDAPAISGTNAPIHFPVTASGLPAIVFHRNGSANAAAGLYLTSERAAGPEHRPYDTRYLAVIRATGRAGWQRYAAAGWQRGF